MFCRVLCRLNRAVQSVKQRTGINRHRIRLIATTTNDAGENSKPDAEKKDEENNEKESRSKAERFLPPRGTHDIFGDQLRIMRAIIERAREIAATYCYEEIATPIIEFEEIYRRSLGQDSDVCMKEMYTFTDKGDNQLALRPENTAGIIRAVLANLNTFSKHSFPVRLFYAGPMFRYERPQKGRFRQFHQTGVELVGSDHPYSDAEVIALAFSILKSMLPSRTLNSIHLLINTLGEAETRLHYRDALFRHFHHHMEYLSPDSVARLQRGSVLRILDSKAPQDADIIATAPSLHDYLSKRATTRFDEVCRRLRELIGRECNIVITPRLVRGLDYYDHTVFEFVPILKAGDEYGRATVLAGGRYNRLTEALGAGKVTMGPSVGWAAGVERLAEIADHVRLGVALKKRPIAVLEVREKDKANADNAQEKEANLISSTAIEIANTLRASGFPVLPIYSGNLQAKLSKASTAEAFVSVIVGSKEVAEAKVTLKWMDTKYQETIEIRGIVERMKKAANVQIRTET